VSSTLGAARCGRSADCVLCASQSASRSARAAAAAGGCRSVGAGDELTLNPLTRVVLVLVLVLVVLVVLEVVVLIEYILPASYRAGSRPAASSVGSGSPE